MSGTPATSAPAPSRPIAGARTPATIPTASTAASVRSEARTPERGASEARGTATTGVACESRAPAAPPHSGDRSVCEDALRTATDSWLAGAGASKVAPWSSATSGGRAVSTSSSGNRPRARRYSSLHAARQK